MRKVKKVVKMAIVVIVFFAVAAPASVVWADSPPQGPYRVYPGTVAWPSALCNTPHKYAYGFCGVNGGLGNVEVVGTIYVTRSFRHQGESYLVVRGVGRWVNGWVANIDGWVILSRKLAPVPRPTSTPTATYSPSRSMTVRRVYVVRSGDTLWAIAHRYRVTVRELMELNNLTSSAIWVGQRLLIGGYISTLPDEIYPGVPRDRGMTIYVVQSGDTLSGVAFRYGVALTQLMAMNGITNPNYIWVGQRLRIP